MEQVAVKDIILNFENVTCSSSLTLGALGSGDVYYFVLTGITKIIHSNFGRVFESEESDRATIILNSESNKPILDYNEDGNATLLFDRITKWNDIVSITLNYEDGTSRDIFVPWDKNNDCTNSWQHCKLDKDGRLNIDIWKDYIDEREVI